MEKAWYRVSNNVAIYFLKKGGRYIRYPDITRDCGFFRDDGIHLLDIGNNIFINTVQGRLETVLTEPNVHVFP
jgi:hypothetical protein